MITFVSHPRPVGKWGFGEASVLPHLQRSVGDVPGAPMGGSMEQVGAGAAPQHEWVCSSGGAHWHRGDQGAQFPGGSGG